MATVTGIIDGTGSLGAAIGPFIAGAMPTWDSLYYVLMSSVFTAALVREHCHLNLHNNAHLQCLIPMSGREIWQKFSRSRGYAPLAVVPESPAIPVGGDGLEVLEVQTGESAV